ncbi:histidine kinase dimerization/phosphoacceptor domain -containing protein [Sulfitobacter sp. LCG007]
MKAVPHPNQEQRLRALHSYEILDTDREKDFDDIAQLAAAICEAPVSLISLVDADRQWFKAETGFGQTQTPLSMSICSHAILEEEFVEISDTLNDPRAAENPLVCGEPGVRFYAGALLTTEGGLPIGTLCVLDYKPRTLTPLQRDALRVLARQVMMQFEMRKALRSAELLRHEVDHRVKNSLQSLSALARIQLRSLRSDEAVSAMTSFRARLDAVSALHEHLYRFDSAVNLDLGEYIRSVCTYLMPTLPSGVSLDVEAKYVRVSASQAVSVGTLVNEFVANSLKHAFPEGEGSIRVSMHHEQDGMFRVLLADDGIGAAEDAAEESGGLGLKIIEVACMELGCELEVVDVERGYARSITFRPEHEVYSHR